MFSTIGDMYDSLSEQDGIFTQAYDTELQQTGLISIMFIKNKIYFISINYLL